MLGSRDMEPTGTTMAAAGCGVYAPAHLGTDVPTSVFRSTRHSDRRCDQYADQYADHHAMPMGHAPGDSVSVFAKNLAIAPGLADPFHPSSERLTRRRGGFCISPLAMGDANCSVTPPMPSPLLYPMPQLDRHMDKGVSASNTYNDAKGVPGPLWSNVADSVAFPSAPPPRLRVAKPCKLHGHDQGEPMRESLVYERRGSVASTTSTVDTTLTFNDELGDDELSFHSLHPGMAPDGPTTSDDEEDPGASVELVSLASEPTSATLSLLHMSQIFDDQGGLAHVSLPVAAEGVRAPSVPPPQLDYGAIQATYNFPPLPVPAATPVSSASSDGESTVGILGGVSEEEHAQWSPYWLAEDPLGLEFASVSLASASPADTCNDAIVLHDAKRRYPETVLHRSVFDEYLLQPPARAQAMGMAEKEHIVERAPKRAPRVRPAVRGSTHPHSRASLPPPLRIAPVAPPMPSYDVYSPSLFMSPQIEAAGVDVCFRRADAWSYSLGGDSRRTSVSSRSVIPPAVQSAIPACLAAYDALMGPEPNQGPRSAYPSSHQMPPLGMAGPRAPHSASALPPVHDPWTPASVSPTMTVTPSTATPSSASPLTSGSSQTDKRRRKKWQWQPLTHEMVTATPDHDDGYMWRCNGFRTQGTTQRRYFRCRFRVDHHCPVTKVIKMIGPSEYLVQYHGQHLPICAAASRNSSG